MTVKPQIFKPGFLAPLWDWPGVFALGAILALNLVLFSLAFVHNQGHLQQEFAGETNQQQLKLVELVRNVDAAAGMLANSFLHDHGVDDNLFRMVFEESHKRWPFIKAAFYAPQILADERQLYERAVRKGMGMPGFQIQGGEQAAFLYPLRFYEPFSPGAAQRLGQNLGDIVFLHKAITQVLIRGRPTLVHGDGLVDRQADFWLLYPLKLLDDRDAKPSSKILGLVAVAIDIEYFARLHSPAYGLRIGVQTEAGPRPLELLRLNFDGKASALELYQQYETSAAGGLVHIEFKRGLRPAEYLGHYGWIAALTGMLGSGLILMLAWNFSHLRQARTRYLTVANFTYDWETWVLPDGRWVYCSPSCLRFTGYQSHEFIQDPALFLRLVHPDDRLAMEMHVRECLHGSEGCAEVAMINFRIRRQDGHETWVEHICQAVHDEQGHYLGRRASHRDISQTIAYQQQLEEARDRAQAANRAKSVFLANMSHELRTPLNAIIGFAQLMHGNTGLSEQERHNLGVIKRSGDHLLKLINEILEISHIEAGQVRLKIEAFSLSGLLGAVEEKTRLQAEQKGLRLELMQGPGLPEAVEGDALHLRQVLLNLLSNAIKYTEQGQITLGIKRDCPGHLNFWVRDTGPGISPKDREHIFDAFYQTDLGVALGVGTGLGLAISQEFVKLMGGELLLESRPGIGSCFHFSIPLTEAVGIEVPPLPPIANLSLELAQDQPAPRILVAEDQPDSQELMQQLLRDFGCEVMIAVNGQQAIGVFASWQPQLIFMDMRMPVMDGYAATSAIRALPGGTDIPILALTASAFEEDKVRILAAGCNEILKKPIDTRELFGSISKYLGLGVREAMASATTPQRQQDRGLGRLSEAQCQLLAKATLELDKDAVMAFATSLGEDYAPEAGLIRRLAEGYEFDRLLQLVRDGVA